MNSIDPEYSNRKKPGLNRSYLTSKVPQERYPLLIRGSLLITTGSLIAVVETFIAIYIGLHHVSYKQAAFITIFVLSANSILISIPYFKKNLLVWHEWAVFTIYMILYQIGFCLWIYRLGDLRFLALINAFTVITILLSYTNIIQSFMISTGSLLCYLLVSCYSIKIAGQTGSIMKEIFYSFCLFPAFILITASAYYITRNREELQKASSKLKNLNYILSEANNMLKKEQSLSKIEMDLAKEIQNAIFPGKPPVTSDWDIAFLTRPHGAVSGDFYDFYCRDNSLKGIALFDVSGHGVAPALITILAKPVLYFNFNHYVSSRLGMVIESVNSELLDQLEEINLYITGLLLRMNGHEVEYVNAGHPDLLHLQSSENKVYTVKDNADSFKGHPIGINLTDKEYLSVRFIVPSGDFLIFYSDGLIECRNYMGEQFGLNRLSDAIKTSTHTDASGILGHIMNSLNAFTGNIKAGDDISLIVAGKL